MSLGSDGGSPTDPTSIAVDNAIQLGVVFCVAAGNSGGRTPVQGKENNYFFDGSQTISSPGTAELGITVGASVLSDTVARFSSKGPNRMSFSVKPEVVAPGVDINSTYLGSTFRVLTGTSMATPMVTGVAALIKSVHPSWSPAMIKSAIVNKAKDLGRSAYLQGGGRVQALNSVSAKTLIEPSTLSYGLDDPSTATWTSSKTLYVFNKHTATQSYAVITNGALPGISLNELDQGPVILQDVFHIRVGEDTLDDVKARGRELEAKVLSQAVQLCLNDQLVVKDKKVIFRPGHVREAS